MTKDDVLENYYNSYDEDQRLRPKHGQVEFFTTMRYIQTYLRPGMRILEIGAGTGMYSLALARQGYQVDAVELVQHNLDLFQQKVEAGLNLRLHQGDALDLGMFADQQFDLVLSFGPMYHLYTEQDQLRALSEALRVTKSNGLLFNAYCIADASILTHGFVRGHIFELFAKGLVDRQSYQTTSTPAEVFQLYRKEQIDALMEHFPTERLHYVATDLLSHFLRESIDTMSDELFDAYLTYHYSICERPDMLGLTNHSLDIVRKL
jgi:ubiquinone/menaquinone biosynthesis C-methylase UbiE